MKVEKWGDGLVIRLPANIVDALGLHEGDQIEIRAVGERRLEIVADDAKDAALFRLRSLRRLLPAGFRVCRDEVNERQSSGDE
jgi:antitoxin MazE